MPRKKDPKPAGSGRKSERFELRLEPDLLARVEVQAKRLHVPQASFFRMAVVHFLETLEQPPKE